MVRAFNLSDMPPDFQKKCGANRAKPRKARKRSDPRDREAGLQALCEQYLNVRNVLYFRLPDNLMKWFFGRPGAAPLHALTECKRYLYGWPDLLVFDQGRYLAIELKSPTGRLKHEQKRKLRILGGHVIRSFDDFKAVVDSWLTDRNSV